jgi:ribose-phosphate pyrophosphokinase
MVEPLVLVNLPFTFDAPIAIIDKRRPKPNVAEVMNIIGDVDGKNVIIVDDIVDTAEP